MIIQGNDPFTQPSFSCGNRIARAIWSLVWFFFFRPTPRIFHAWRRSLLRLFGAKLGHHVNVHADVSVWAPWMLTIGNRVGIANGVRLYNMAPIDIEDNCVVSQGAHLCCGTHDIDSPNFQLNAKPIRLASHVWVCAEAFVGPGVSVAEGCVLGARAVVVRSINDPWTVWVGNPAVMKRKRKQL